MTRVKRVVLTETSPERCWCLHREGVVVSGGSSDTVTRTLNHYHGERRGGPKVALPTEAGFAEGVMVLNR